MIEQGFVHNVYTRTAGSQALSSAAVGATTIFVQDAADFPETGGQVSITSLDSVSALDVKITYDYISADLDLDTITLATPLESALAVGDRVDVWPVAVTKLADVMLIDTEEPVTARVEHSIVNLLPEGVRDPAAQEQAVVRLADDDWWLTNLPVREPTIQSPNFDEAGTGFQVGAEAAQFQNMNVVDSLGVDALAVNNLSINGQDLETELISRPTFLPLTSRRPGHSSTPSTWVSCCPIGASSSSRHSTQRAQSQVIPSTSPSITTPRARSLRTRHLATTSSTGLSPGGSLRKETPPSGRA
jgi:hypothetical protein